MNIITKYDGLTWIARVQGEQRKYLGTTKEEAVGELIVDIVKDYETICVDGIFEIKEGVTHA